MKIREGTNSSHSSYYYSFFSFFRFWYFLASIEHHLIAMNLFKKYPSHIKFKKKIISSKKWRFGRYEECEDSSHSMYPCSIFSIFRFSFFWASIEYPLSVMPPFKKHPSHVRSETIFKTLRSGDSRAYEECENSSLFIPLLTF